MTLWPTTWQGWAVVLAVAAYLLGREAIHRWWKRRMR